MKRLKPFVAVLGILVAAGVIYMGVQYFAYSYLDDKSSMHKSTAATCESKGVDQRFVIQNSVFNPAHIVATVCDTLTITNRDDKIREIAFGKHSQHVAYDGVLEKTLQKNDSFTVTLNETGSFIIHDHFQDETQAYFVVK